MRKSLLIIVLPLIAMGFWSCDDNDDEGLKIQNHDDNEMMAIMHDMSAEMDAMQMTGDADHDFANMMIMHHQGAIDMANKELEKGDVAELRSMAQSIIDKQEAEQNELNAFLETHTPESSTAGQEFDMEIMTFMDKADRNADLQVITGDVDHDFAMLMIIHHQSASDVAQSLLHHGHHEELMEMARIMIDDQNMEIKQLQEWLLQNKSY